MKTQALLAAATLLVALPAAGFPAAVLPAAAVEPAHLVADLDPGLAPFHPSGDHADFSGYVTVGGVADRLVQDHLGGRDDADPGQMAD
ncbi:MAG TPA: hypothetical protein VGQ28_04890 [Thermoanaerobaculia bacterium]|nr:hypothetical protein [Thermoanaerobaculia bacterium]